ncbi:hypothetical protein O181_097105 [Austropuccinia psidii MF-1]|uniref:Uncharacterized protein n=1 Tax=Austropuccinia psidii MF-1 TaxID=1389203 RepID=A0A9Q3PDM2_9BASI|nr:hypothetical protein [Austropuccinia psidii MF-1]
MGYQSLSNSIRLVSQRKAHIATYRQSSSEMKDVHEILEELFRTFQIIQVLIRNRLLELADSNSKRIQVSNLAHLHNELNEDWTHFRNRKPEERPIFVITKESMNQLTQKLSDLLQSASFPSRTGTLSPSKAQPDWKAAAEIKVTFEKCVFQSIDIMYKHRISTADDLKRFSSSEKVLQLIESHLIDIYEGVIHAGVRHEAAIFIPDFEFITKDWKTAHLHNILKELSAEQQGKLIYNLVIWLLDHYLAINHERTEEGKLLEQVKQHSLFKPARETSASTSVGESALSATPGSDTVVALVSKLVAVVENSIPQKHDQEYTMSYHLLRFAKTFSTSFESQLVVQELKNNEIARKKFELLDAGQLLEASILQLFQCRRYLPNLSLEDVFIQEQFSPEKETLLLEDAADLLHAYARKKNELIKFEEKDSELKDWLHEHAWLSFYDTLEAGFPGYGQDMHRPEL